MKMTPAALALATALAAAMPVAQAQDVAPLPWSDAEVAHLAARWQQADFARGDQMCSQRKYRRPLADGLTTYVQAHPEYTAALAYEPSPEFAAVADRVLGNLEGLLAPMTAMMASAPAELRDPICDELVGERATYDFAKKIESARNLLADDQPPPPEEPLTELAAAEVGPIVALVLQHPDVAMYLHPDAPGRVPVRVAVAAPYDSAPIDLALYGAPVRSSDNGDRDAVQLVFKPHGEHVQVEVKYDPEGIFGTVELQREGGVWRAVDAKIFE